MEREKLYEMMMMKTMIVVMVIVKILIKNLSLQFWMVQNCKKITGKIFSPNIGQKWVIYEQKT